uniref:Uncharacterized protein n=1 Tax=Vitis vinifera TaxID=29760 RepID=F6HVH0_VITVI
MGGGPPHFENYMTTFYTYMRLKMLLT